MTNIWWAIIRSLMPSPNTQISHNTPVPLVLPTQNQCNQAYTITRGLAALVHIYVKYDYICFQEQNINHHTHSFFAVYPTYNYSSIISLFTVTKFHEEHMTAYKEHKERWHLEYSFKSRMCIQNVPPVPNIYRKTCAVIWKCKYTISNCNYFNAILLTYFITFVGNNTIFRLTSFGFSCTAMIFVIWYLNNVKWYYAWSWPLVQPKHAALKPYIIQKEL